MVTKHAISFDQYPLFKPESSWKIPSTLPDLSQETEIAIDTETFDNSLQKNMGPGYFKCEPSLPNTGYVCGLSVAWRDQAIYIPLKHNRKSYFDHGLVQRWLKALASQNHTNFIFHSFQYDWGWLQAMFDVQPPANVDDVAAMASMIDENLTSFSLDSLCHWQGLPGKDEVLLKEIAGLHKIKEADIKQYMHEYDPEYVGPYAEQDAISTLLLVQKLRPLLEHENLINAYQVERDLMPLTLRMKQRGIKVDAARARKLSEDILNQCNEDLINLSKSLGEKVGIKQIRSSHWLSKKFADFNMIPPRTRATQNFETNWRPSFEKSYMANHQHWFPRMIHKIKHQTDLAERFLQKFIVEYEYRGRVHATINQFRSETGGARSHRFSYSDPPLQQMPSRDDEWAPLIRSCFIPEEGETWYSVDYRQQEYRLIVFVAELLRARGAKKAADKYRNDPDTDFHNYVAQITRLERRRAKDVNFAKSYGAGVRKFALMTGMSEEEAQSTMEQYDEELPFVGEASEKYMRFASNNGYIKLIDGARNHFNLWEPVYRDYAREDEYKARNKEIDIHPCSEKEAKRRRDDINHPWYGERFKRSYTHKAFNRMIQGSAARQTKKAMVDIYKAGYTPLLQLHDELCFSFTNRKDAEACAKMMQEAMPVISIPMSTDIEYGPNWGTLKK